MNKVILTLACIMAFAAAGAQNNDRKSRLENHLYYLASDSLHGRKAGTEDAAKARAYVLEQWNEIGLEPFFREGFEDTFYQNGQEYTNLVALIPGSDPNLNDQYILIGAHLDHIGYKHGEICNGADDNASGSSALIEVARILKENQSQLKRGIIIAAFDAEELGLYGSNHLADRLLEEDRLYQVRCMMSMDMVGWYAKNGKLELKGAGTIDGGRELLQKNAGGLKLDISNFETAVLTATDTRGFAKKHVPTLHIYTGLKSPYHKPADDADLIDYVGLDSITCYISRVATSMASVPEFNPSGRIAAVHMDQAKPFEVAVGGGFTTSNIGFPESIISAKGGYGWNAGLSMQYNFKAYAIRLGAAYETAKAFYPDQTDLFHSKLTFRQSAVEVPLTFIIQNPDPMARFYFGGGANLRYRLDSSLEGLNYDTNQIQWGWHFMFGVKLGRIFIEDYFYGQSNNLFDKDSGAPNADLNVTTFKIGLIF